MIQFLKLDPLINTEVYKRVTFSPEKFMVMIG